MLKLLVIGFGGFLGANARYWLSLALNSEGFPWGTLLVNVLGCFGLAFFATYALESSPLAPNTRLFVSAGFFGAFTTFSTYNLEALNLLQGGKYLAGLGYILLSVGLGMGAGILGMALAR